jgi:hypothetical protein
MPQNIMTQSIMTPIAKILSITTASITSPIRNKKKHQHNIMRKSPCSIVIIDTYIQDAIMLNVIMLSVIISNVVAPLGLIDMHSHLHSRAKKHAKKYY